MHRAGHNEDLGNTLYSMDRRKYLSTLAAGAALGTVAVGLAACGGDDDSTNVTGRNLWGYLRVFPHDVTRIEYAKPEMLKGVNTIRIPYYNNTGVDMSKNPIVGFSLLMIGCPAKFAMAINLIVKDDHDENHPPNEKVVERNKRMDETLLGMGYEALPWDGPDNTECSK